MPPNNGIQRRPRSEFRMVTLSVRRGPADAKRWAGIAGIKPDRKEAT